MSSVLDVFINTDSDGVHVLETEIVSVFVCEVIDFWEVVMGGGCREP